MKSGRAVSIGKRELLQAEEGTHIVDGLVEGAWGGAHYVVFRKARARQLVIQCP